MWMYMCAGFVFETAIGPINPSHHNPSFPRDRVGIHVATTGLAPFFPNSEKPKTSNSTLCYSSRFVSVIVATSSLYRSDVGVCASLGVHAEASKTAQSRSSALPTSCPVGVEAERSTSPRQLWLQRSRGHGSAGLQTPPRSRKSLDIIQGHHTCPEMSEYPWSNPLSTERYTKACEATAVSRVSEVRRSSMIPRIFACGRTIKASSPSRRSRRASVSSWKATCGSM